MGAGREHRRGGWGSWGWPVLLFSTLDPGWALSFVSSHSILISLLLPLSSSFLSFLQGLAEDKDALEEALMRLKRAFKLLQEPAAVSVQKRLVPRLLSLTRTVTGTTKRVRA